MQGTAEHFLICFPYQDIKNNYSPYSRQHSHKANLRDANRPNLTVKISHSYTCSYVLYEDSCLSVSDVGNLVEYAEVPEKILNCLL